MGYYFSHGPVQRRVNRMKSVRSSLLPAPGYHGNPLQYYRPQSAPTQASSGVWFTRDGNPGRQYIRLWFCSRIISHRSYPHERSSRWFAVERVRLVPSTP